MSDKGAKNSQLNYDKSGLKHLADIPSSGQAWISSERSIIRKKTLITFIVGNFIGFNIDTAHFSPRIDRKWVILKNKN